MCHFGTKCACLGVYTYRTELTERSPAMPRAFTDPFTPPLACLLARLLVDLLTTNSLTHPPTQSYALPHSFLSPCLRCLTAC